MFVLEIGGELIDELFEVWVVCARETQQADSVETGVVVCGFCDFENSFDAAVAHGSSGEAGLAESAAVGTAAHNLDGETLVDRLNEWNDWSSGDGRGIEVFDYGVFESGTKAGDGRRE